MRNGDIVGYEMWKATVLPSIKGISDGAEMLISLIQEKVTLNFAITIDQEFETHFIETSKKIISYITDNYGDFNDLDKDYEKYTAEIFEKVKEVEQFIDLLNNQLSISIQILNGEEEKQCYLALTFPNPESKDLMNAQIKGSRSYTEQPLAGKHSPAFDEKNPSMLKFLGIRDADKNMTLIFPNEDMGSQLFNTLPSLRLTLGCYNYDSPVIKPLENNIAMADCPEYLLGYTQLLIVPQFPETLNPGALYVQIEGVYQNISLRSRAILKAIPIEMKQKKEFKKALEADDIKINFEHFKDDYQLQIAQNKSVFKLVRQFCPSQAAFTVKERLKPIKTFFGDHLLPQGQAMSLSAVEAEVRMEEYKSLARSSDNALQSVVEKIKDKATLEVSVRELEKEKKSLEQQLKILNPKYFEPEASEPTNSRCFSFFGCLTLKKNTTPADKYELKQNPSEEASKKIIALDAQYKSVCFKLENLFKDLRNLEIQTQKVTNEYTSLREKQRLLRTQPRSSSNDTIEPPSQTLSTNNSRSSLT